jgi:hypothetical protein
MTRIIAVLEDDMGRTTAMKEALDSAPFGAELVFFDNAPDMISWLKSNLANVCLLCLDHDLGPNRVRDDNQFDPGIGRDVVDFLVTQSPTCVVIIHSSNAMGANGMTTALEGAGWSAERVVPYDDLVWVKERWNARVRSYLSDERGVPFLGHERVPPNGEL